MKKSFTKILAILLIISLNWTGLSAVIKTVAYFNDTEISQENSYSAGTLDLSLRSGQSNFVPLETALNMKPGDIVARDIYIKKEGSLPFKYNAVSEPVEGSCDLELYNSLELKIWYNYYTDIPIQPNYHEYRIMALKYDGLLKDFDLRDLNPNDSDLEIPNSHSYFENSFYGPDEHWFYASEIILPENISAELQNKSCEFKFVFDGWQTDFVTSPNGFTDREFITSTISTGDWMPDVHVEYPDGGEIWYMVPDSCSSIPSCSLWCQNHGMNAECQYSLEWTAVNKISPDEDLLIDIYYSTDSGFSWMPQIVNDTYNDGVYEWKIPYDMSYISEHARIKVVATHKDYPFLTNSDMSDTDFCPPMLTLEDLLDLEESTEEEKMELGLLPLEEQIATTTTSTIPDTSTTIPDEITISTTTIDFISSPSTSTITIIETPVEESIATTTITEPPVEELDITEDTMTTSTTISPITEEILVEETSVIDEPVVIEESLIIEETPVNETLVIEQIPAIEEHPVIAPVDNNSEEQSLPADNSNSGGDAGGGETVSATPSDGATE